MASQNFMNKLRQWDSKANQWFFRHFYLLFFQVILVIAFVIFFVLTLNLINLAPDMDHKSALDRLLLTQNASTLLIAFLLILNSFWMLFMLTSLFRIRSVLKNVDFNLSRRRTDRKNDDQF
ncbi:MAG: hypothetical protein HGA80_00075 [Candidatus Omnitrophica bacterium]|nr:hypothetical protein [Candidatus Omnitrophota bacterium]